MQALLPSKAEREAALAEPAGWIGMITLARQAAVTIAGKRGLVLRQPLALPTFVPSP